MTETTETVQTFTWATVCWLTNCPDCGEQISLTVRPQKGEIVRCLDCHKTAKTHE